MALAELALTLTLLAPQGQDQADPRFTSALSAAEQKKLNDLAKKWFEAEKKYVDEPRAEKRAKLASSRMRAREKFMKEWEGKEKKEPIKHVGDLLAVFANVFPYERRSGTGTIRPEKVGKDTPFDIVVPKGYDEDECYPTLVVVPERGESGWADGTTHYDATWKGVDAVENWLIVVPRVSDAMELDPLPDLSTTSGDSLEKDRIGAMFAPVGEAQQRYRFDRNQLILDCSKGSCGFGMRLASYFPSRFAGLILRHPTEFGALAGGEQDLRENFVYGSLAALPVLLIRSADTAEACGRIAGKLNELEPGSCQVLEADDSELRTKIGEWAKTARRDLFCKKVVLAPNHDLFRKGYWVAIDTAESVGAGPEGRPYLKAEADRAGNRIIVEARNVNAFQLLLNDAIVNLDEDFTVVVNGKAVTEKLQRSFYTLTEFLSFTLFDASRVWTATYRTTVPQGDSGTAPGGGGGSSGG